MSPRFRVFVWALLAALGACAGSRCDAAKGGGASNAPAGESPRPDLRLVLLTDPRGYLEPCGCQQRPLGGVDKLATLVGEARRDRVPTALLAAGDLTFGSELKPEDAEGARTQELWRAETLVEIWKRIGMVAVAPGPLDLGQGPETLAKLGARSGFAWIADNVRKSAAEPAPLARAQVLDVQGIKLGVLGLCAPDPVHPPARGLALAADLSSLARQKSSELRAAGARLVVALVSADRRSARALAGKGPDLIVMGGLDLERALPPAVHEGTVLLHAGRQGQNALLLELGLSADAGASGWEDASEWTRREARNELERQIRELRARIAGWEKDSKVAEGDLAVQRARLAELEAERARPHIASFSGRWFRAELKELAPEIPGEPAIAAQLDAHDRRVNEHNRRALADRKPLPAPPGSASYAGSESCKSCHEPAYKWWRATQHGNAYATLEQVDKQYNLSCVGCHVTGYNQPGGSTVTHVENLKDVGCENCHGPGSLHNGEPEQPGLIARDAPESVCAGCHTHEHSDHFVFASYRAMMIAPGHGLPSDRQ